MITNEITANENFPLKSVSYLKSKNFDIKAIGLENASIKDSAVIESAIQEERTILTFDRDYGELIFRHNYKPEKLIEELLNKKEIDFANALTVIDKNGIRQRKY